MSLDDELRDALRSADDVTPARPSFDDVRRRARRQTGRRRALTTAAVVVIAGVAGATAVVANTDNGDTVIADDADTTTTTTIETTTSTTPDATASTTEATAEPVAPGPRPDRVVVVTEVEGRILVIDVDTGDVLTDLGTLPPDDGSGEGEPFFVADVAIAADDSVVYVDICCEPAGGNLQRIPADGSIRLSSGNSGGGPSESYFTAGYTPRPSPDGGRIAFDAYMGVVVAEADEEPNASWSGEAAHDSGSTVGALAWSVRGLRLAWTENWIEEDSVGSIHFADVSPEGHIDTPERIDPPVGVKWVQVVFRNDGNLIVVERDPSDGDLGRVLDPDTGGSITTFPFDGDVLSIGYDPTGTWLLVVYGDGRLVAMGGGETFEIATGIATADW